MKEIFAGIGKFFLEILKALDWKSVLYKTCKVTILPILKKKVDDSTSKIDDAIYKGLEGLVDKFLAPTPTPKLLAETPVEPAHVS